MPTIDKNFMRAIEWVLSHEGGFADHPRDRGGATKYGISLRFLKNLVDGDLNDDRLINNKDIACLTRDQAIDFYRREFWEKYDYGLIIDVSIAAKIFDLAVNMGPARAHRLTQHAISTCGHSIRVDGKLGPKTLAILNNLDRHAFLPAFCAAAAGFYRALVDRDPSQKVFLDGWLRRAYAEFNNGETL